MNTLRIDAEKCIQCHACVRACPLFCYVSTSSDETPTVHEKGPERCIACGHCIAVCPTSAVSVNGVDADQCEEAPPPSEEAFDSFAALAKTRRSIRRFRREPIAREQLERLMAIVQYAPTARNTRSVEWIIVNNFAQVNDLAGMVIEHMRREDLFPGMVRAWENGHDGVHRGAPCLAIAHAPKAGGLETIDCTIALETLDLGATALGLGACWAGFFMLAARQDPKIAQALDVPRTRSIEGAMMLGLPDIRYLHIPPRPAGAITWRE